MFVIPGNDGAVHGGYRILYTIPGCALPGVQTSESKLLGAYAIRFRRKRDS